MKEKESMDFTFAKVSMKKAFISVQNKDVLPTNFRRSGTGYLGCVKMHIFVF